MTINIIAASMAYSQSVALIGLVLKNGFSRGIYIIETIKLKDSIKANIRCLLDHKYDVKNLFPG